MGTIFDDLPEEQQADAEEIFRGIESTWGLDVAPAEDVTVFNIHTAHAILSTKEAL